MDPIHESPSGSAVRNRRRFCFFFRCLSGSGRSSSSSSSWWQKIRTGSARIGGSGGVGGGFLWSRGVGALRKIREWSETVAAPRWKTLLRRFSRRRGGNRHVNLGYDPLSYSLNFDDGQGQNGILDAGGEDGYYYASRNFSSRYANGSLDFSQGGPKGAGALDHS